MEKSKNYSRPQAQQILNWPQKFAFEANFISEYARKQLSSKNHIYNHWIL